MHNKIKIIYYQNNQLYIIEARIIYSVQFIIAPDAIVLSKSSIKTDISRLIEMECYLTPRDENFGSKMNITSRAREKIDGAHPTCKHHNTLTQVSII